jgi:imidazole glycerol phosphate synthase subunit HisF
MGAGEILLNAIDNDGKGQGFDLALVQSVSSAVTIPVIASSGAGSPEHFTEVRVEKRAVLCCELCADCMCEGSGECSSAGQLECGLGQ